ncbi:hypothetical protein FRC04_002557 [Tulasnella sp. 424]|nr:hypothetical protein FRC04_002557 [Tulasnella sp. 424]
MSWSHDHHVQTTQRAMMDSGGGFIHSSHPNNDNQFDPPTPSSTLVDDQDEVRPVHPLSKAQERRLRDYLDAKLLEINRGFKKRITGDMLTAIPAYPLVGPPPTSNPQPSDPPALEVTLIELIDCISQLDKGWAAVLASQAWDPAAGEGRGAYAATGGPSETDKARLRSILLLGREAIIDWLALGQVQLEQEIQEEFSCVFWRALRNLGEGAAITSDNIAVDLDDSEEDENN